MTGESYEVITNNLRSDVYSQLANIAQMITMITIDRVIEDGKQVASSRSMWFRSNGLVDCGTRFPQIPEKLPLSAENFMLAFETGVKSSMKKKVTDEEMKEMAIKEQQQADQTPAPSPKTPKAEPKDKAEILKELQAKCQDKAVLKVAMTVMKEKGYEHFKAMSETDLQELVASL